jgi:hypothetical protein
MSAAGTPPTGRDRLRRSRPPGRRGAQDTAIESSSQPDRPGAAGATPTDPLAELDVIGDHEDGVTGGVGGVGCSAGPDRVRDKPFDESIRG